MRVGSMSGTRLVGGMNGVDVGMGEQAEAKIKAINNGNRFRRGENRLVISLLNH